MCLLNIVLDENFKLNIPEMSYENITSYEKCKNFFEFKNGKYTCECLESYLNEAGEYIDAIKKAIYGSSKEEYINKLMSRFVDGLSKKYKKEYGENFLKERRSHAQEFEEEKRQKRKEIKAIPYENGFDDSILVKARKSLATLLAEVEKNIKNLEKPTE